MKNLLSLVLLLSVLSLHAQQTADRFSDNQSEQSRNPRLDQMNFVPNEVIVKFKDEAPVKSGAALKTAGISNVDQILKANGVDSLVQLFPTATNSLLRSTGTNRIVKDPHGQDMVIPNLDKIYLIKIPQLRSTNAPPVNLFQLIDELKNQPEVEYAEPNYIYSIDDLEPVGEVLTAEDLARKQNVMNKASGNAVIPNDPLYSQQPYINEIKADLVWEQATGDSTQVIGVLDTGVDWTHPDLKNKIWKNPDEIPNNGIDDDNNNYIDDYMGWDFIYNDNNPMDDNSHGTHVAGIAAAETNNGIGIAGVNWHAKIMPLKVFPASGYGDVITITRGIMYAAQMGATVMNMSFGSYARSFTLENALKNAYPTCIHVAAAGNDTKSIYDIDPFGNPYIMYPAAFEFVLGIQATEGFSNYDPDGPLFSTFTADAFNYELKAPGTVLSTIPKGNYRILQGTSMATPIVAGTVALYRSLYPDKTLEELWSDFIHSNSGVINTHNAMFNTSTSPKLDLVSFEIKDINEDCDKDNKADAGETIDLVLRIRNTGQPCNNVYAVIKPSGDSDPNDITIVKDSIGFGSIGIYRSQTNGTTPFKIQISNTCVNNSYASIDVYMSNDVDTVIFIQNIKFNIFNGQELSGILLRDTTLTADKNWVISNSLRISTGVTITIEPGASVEVLADVDNRGNVYSVGSPDNVISIKGIIEGSCEYKYVDFDLDYKDINIQSIEHCRINHCGNLQISKIEYCLLENVDARALAKIDTMVNTYYTNSIITSSPLFISNSILYNLYLFFANSQIIKETVLHKIGDGYSYIYPSWADAWRTEVLLSSNLELSTNNSFLDNINFMRFISSYGPADYQNYSNQYWGTINKTKIKKKYIDFNDNPGLPYLNIEPMLSKPSDLCHAHVWKILVNGRDAQDEIVEPVGVGKQRFDVFFNRLMDTTITPQVTFGALYPYTSIPINEEGSWSEDGKIYTVYKTIKLTTVDGINRIRVAGAKEANGWDFEIPVEDSRFEFVVSAASSSSLEFMATPGLGKVDLEWNNNDLEDGLGYNMYRMEHINDSTLTEPIIVNSTLITDTLFTDYNVVPNKKYYYYYKILRTNMSETDASKTISATPFTANKGDANGDLSVNVLDITTIVAHLLQNNPQPFIFEAADYNSDATVNVLDIVGVVNHVLYGDLRSATSSEDQVSLYLRNDTLFADASTDIGGLQLELAGISSMDKIKVLSALEGFESGYSQLDSSHIRLIYYSLSGKVIPAGKRIPLLLISEGEVESAIAGDKAGKNIPMSLTAPSEGNSSKGRTLLEVGQNYPNPAGDETLIPVILHQDMDQASLRIYDLQGIGVNTIRLPDTSAGSYDIKWNTAGRKGIFIYRLEARKANEQFVCPVRKMVVL